MAKAEDSQTNNAQWVITGAIIGAVIALLSSQLSRWRTSADANAVTSVQQGALPVASSQPHNLLPTNVEQNSEPEQDVAHQSQESNEARSKRELNWDVIGFASAAVALIGAAIFYLAGWIYEAHWYAFYGLDVAQLNLAPFHIMIQGVPSIFLLILCSAISLVILAFSQIIASPEKPQTQFLTSTIIRTYFLAVNLIIIAGLVLGIISNGRILAWEVFVSMIAGLIIITVAQLVIMLDANAQAIMASFTGNYSAWPKGISYWLWLQVTKLIVKSQKRIYRSAWFRRRAIAAGNQQAYVDFLNAGYTPLAAVSSLKPEYGVAVTDFIETYHKQRKALIKKAVETWQLWLALFVALFFLVSVSISALLGDFDALRGARTLSGSWEVPPAYVVGAELKPHLLPCLPERDDSATNSDAFGPVGLLTSNETSLFLVQLKENTNYYQARPSLCVLSRESVESILLVRD
jgi:hypothetical protein